MRFKKLLLISVVSFLLFPKAACAFFKWNMGAAVLEGYDDNVTYAHSNKITDATTRATIGGGFTAAGKNASIVFKSAVTANIFARHSSLNNLAEDISVGVAKDFTPYDHVNANESFRHAEDPRNFEDAFGRSNGRYSTYTNKYIFEYSRVLSEQLKTTFRYHQLNTSYSRDDLNDAAQYSPGVSTEYALNSANTLLGDYNYIHQSFDKGGHADIQTVSAGLRHFLTNQWFVDVKPGVNFITNFDGSSLIKPRYELGLTDDVDINTKINLKYIMEYSANGYSQDIFNNWKTVLSLNRQLTARINADISAFYGKGQYTTTGITDQLTGANMGITYELTKKSQVFVNYTYERTDSNQSVRSFFHNIFQLGLKFIF